MIAVVPPSVRIPRGGVMKYVLFVCNHNAGRSQMAQAYFERDAPPDVRAESAGSEPARAVWPAVIRACADAILTRYDDVPVRSYVLTLAHRQTRDCLAADTCDALAITQ
jgi:low molecular weight phosphotyrosine protein phosphatase